MRCLCPSACHGIPRQTCGTARCTNQPAPGGLPTPCCAGAQPARRAERALLQGRGRGGQVRWPLHGGLCGAQRANTLAPNFRPHMHPARRKTQVVTSHLPLECLPSLLAHPCEQSRYSEQSRTKCIGMTIETRPDFCLTPHLAQMLSYGCTRLEIGLQVGRRAEEGRRGAGRGGLGLQFGVVCACAAWPLHPALSMRQCYCLATPLIMPLPSFPSSPHPAPRPCRSPRTRTWRATPTAGTPWRRWASASTWPRTRGSRHAPALHCAVVLAFLCADGQWERLLGTVACPAAQPACALPAWRIGWHATFGGWQQHGAPPLPPARPPSSQPVPLPQFT